jgi:hypothetical protein
MSLLFSETLSDLLSQEIVLKALGRERASKWQVFEAVIKQQDAAARRACKHSRENFRLLPICFKFMRQAGLNSMWERFVERSGACQAHCATHLPAQTSFHHLYLQVPPHQVKPSTHSLHKTALDFIPDSALLQFKRSLTLPAVTKSGSIALIFSSKETKKAIRQISKQHCSAHCAATVRQVLLVRDYAT